MVTLFKEIEMKRRRIEFRIAPDVATMFFDRCRKLDANPSAILRRLVTQWLDNYANDHREFRCIHGVAVKGGTVCEECRQITGG